MTKERFMNIKHYNSALICVCVAFAYSPAEGQSVSQGHHVSFTAATTTAPAPAETQVIKKLPGGAIEPAADTAVPDSGEVLMRVKLGQGDYVLYKGSLAQDAAVVRFGLPKGWSLRDAITSKVHGAVYPCDRNEVVTVYFDRYGILTDNSTILYFYDGAYWRTILPEGASGDGAKAGAKDDETISRYAKLARACEDKKSSRCGDILLTLATNLEQHFNRAMHVEDYQCAVFMYGKVEKDYPDIAGAKGVGSRLDKLLKAGGIERTAVPGCYDLLSLIERK
jgi:hypothetical protein